MSRKSGRLQTKQYHQTNIPRILARGKRKADEAEECEPPSVKRLTPNPQAAPPTPGELTVATDHLSSLHIRNASFRNPSLESMPSTHRTSPLPVLSWADSGEMWSLMCKKDCLYKRDIRMLDHHPSLQSRMRAILLDWLIEVCEVYKLHRETYYLAVDYIDRYLTVETNIPKQQLQLIGITALFLASKLEEIYPPKLTEFAYVTDGACKDNEILDKELVMLKKLNWDLTPMTVNSWLNIYLQVTNQDNCQEGDDALQVQYSPQVFVQLSQLIDLCMLDIGCLQFSYSVVAAAALYHLSSEHVALSVSRFKWLDIKPCVNWMAPFSTAVRDNGGVDLKHFQQVFTDDFHNIQTHDVDLPLLERAQARQLEIQQSSRSSPVMGLPASAGMLTPPESGKKEPPQSL
ncbi:PREDICTED: G1/S-specific cyclin-E-like isoform X2 [Priapulus caudatus]|uniref:G1/S-specific cyclin-E-like isoform X2 n=1 Tax=Priapulus caudatus TaxID=37621 RepID=A0ABM1EW51_PRICU|nr:PREDICTED: G1/S-specific cyclin-E-like isoform X2 [Priapulus caudatus]